MHRMSGQDAQFIYDELPDEPQHTLKISILGPEASAAWSIGAARRDLAGRLDRLDPLQWRALRVPLDLHHPVWLADPGLDLRFHLRRLAIPAPGGREELCQVISEILSAPLDPERPLWEMWWLEGYEGGVVSVLKMSHALADGAASRRLLERLHTPELLDADAPRFRGEAPPSRWQLVRDALVDRWREFWQQIPRLARAAHRVRLRIARARQSDPAAGHPPNPLEGPFHPLGGRFSRRRAFHFFSVPLAEAREVGRALDCTVTDVVFASVAGGLRRWLQGRGALPGLPTAAYMPASIRTEDEAELWGNRVTAQCLDLPTQIDCPLERLRAVQAETGRVKRELALRTGSHLEDWIRWLPPAAAKWPGRLMRAFIRWAPRPRRPGFVSITSVRGPDAALVGPWGAVANFVSVGHMKYTAGLNTTVWSYAGQLNFGFYACARAVPDISVFSGANS